MEIELTQNKVAQIDPEDWPLVSAYSWHAKLENGGLWYAATSIRIDGEQRTLKMHDLIMPPSPGMMVDHRNSKATLDNRRSNLRVCTNAQNQQNTGSRGGSSPYKGVSRHTRKRKWLVQFRHEGQYHFVGYFADEVDAAKAYDSAILPLEGEFARLNLPKAA